MIVRTADARWAGDLKTGQGSLALQSGAFAGPYSFQARFGPGEAATNPEELLAAAHAGCFAMQLSHFLAENGTPATELNAKAVVSVDPADGGFAITASAITLEGKVPGIDDAKFQELATKAKEGCPVSKALGAIDVSLTAWLV